MRCPYCGNSSVFYSDSWPLHLVRWLVNSPKRFCPACERKWILKPKNQRAFSWGLAVSVFAAAVLILIMIDNLGVQSFHASKRLKAMPFIEPHLIEKATREKLQEDPEAFNALSPAKKRKVEAHMKKYGLEIPQ